MHQYKQVAATLGNTVFTLNQAQAELTATRPHEGALLWEAARLIEDVRKALSATPQPRRTPTPPMPKQPQYRGDSGRLRRALWECGWFKHAKDMVFHDKCKNWSRVKLWWANSIYEATQAEQAALEAEIRKEFGDRIIKMGFIKHWTDDKSFCVWLRN